MNENQQAKWHRMQKRGMWLYLLEKAAITAIIFFLLDTLLGNGYPLIKQGKWVEFFQSVTWFKFLWLGFIIGFSIGLYSWNRKKKTFGQSHS